MKTDKIVSQITKVAALIVLTTTLNIASELSFSSTQKKTAMIELYTSQGCSSCPPADKWLSELKTHPDLFKRFIPLAFHVTYWDFIGWKDVFAQEEFDTRQRNYAKIWKSRSVYTPQFIVDAKEYREWFSYKALPNFSNELVGKLSLTLHDNQQLSITFDNKTNYKKRATVNIAVLGFDYNIPIKKGENQNRELNHDFVVLEFEQYPINLKKSLLNKKYFLPKLKNNKRKAIVVFITTQKNEPLQAVGGFLN